MKVLIQIILLVFLSQTPVFPGESGELPGEELKDNTSQETSAQNNPGMDSSEEDTSELLDENKNKEEEVQEGLVNEDQLDQLLEPKDTEVTLPKNRLEEIFNQFFMTEINRKQITIQGECEKIMADGKCFIVKPNKSSKHFNNYYFYTNQLGQVYSIIAFNNRKQGDLNICKDRIATWKDYFNSFDFTEKEPLDNPLNFVLSDAPQQNSLEIFASC
ncbi:hypothetical protein EB169_12470, partial [archaeon]|nr:hypothetical protein [archaeon]